MSLKLTCWLTSLALLVQSYANITSSFYILSYEVMENFNFHWTYWVALPALRALIIISMILSSSSQAMTEIHLLCKFITYFLINKHVCLVFITCSTSSQVMQLQSLSGSSLDKIVRSYLYFIESINVLRIWLTFPAPLVMPL
jgi:hypothetical protein